MNHKSINWLTILLMVVLVSCKKDELPPISSFTASGGTRLGVVRLAIENVPGAENYNYERKNPQTNQWEEIHWGNSPVWDDNGWGLPDNKLLAGQVYEYRARAHAEKTGFSDWSEVVSGYIFSPSPKLVSVKYTPAEYYNMTFTVSDKLPAVLYNLSTRTIVISRSETSAFEQVAVDVIDGNIKDSTIILSQNDNAYDPKKSYNYKLKITYRYNFSGLNASNEFVWDAILGDYIYESASISGDDITDNGGSTGTTDYTTNNYGEINSSATGAKVFSIMCREGSAVYLGYLDNYLLTGFGKPVIMKNSGSSWTSAGGALPADILTDDFIDEFDFTAASGTIYLAAMSSDTIYVYKNDGTWSANLTKPVLWGTSKPYYIDIAVLSNELYLTINQNDTIKVFKYQGADWVQVGSDVASGFLVNTKLKEIDGTLYIWYEEWVSGTSQVTLHIQHLNGTSWDNDLQWEKDASADFEIVKTGGNLCFRCRGQSGEYFGGVYKVTSATTVDNLFEGVDLLKTPTSITTDAAGNIVISVITYTTIDDAQLAVYIYEDSAWKMINDDYSEVSFRGSSSAAVQAVNNDIHFVYGLKSSEDAMNYPTILKAKKYSK